MDTEEETTKAIQIGTNGTTDKKYNLEMEPQNMDIGDGTTELKWIAEISKIIFSNWDLTSS